MKHRICLFLLSLLVVVALTACGSGETEQAEVPPLTAVEAMTDDAATEALSGFRRQDIMDAWGDPQEVFDTLSNLHVDLYDAPTRGGWIGILYDTHGLHEKTPESLAALPVCRVDLQLSSLNELVEKGVS